MKLRVLWWLILSQAIFFAPPCFSQQGLPSQPATAEPSKSLIESLNNFLPPWIQFSGQVRFRAEGYTGGSFKNNSDDSYLLTRVLLNMKIKPASWLTLFAQGMDSHAPWKNTLPAGGPFRDTMDVGQAWIEVGPMETSKFGLRLGRQDLSFGEERLVGPAPWLNTIRSFDGAQGSMHIDGVRIDAFATRAVKISQETFDESTPGNNFYGVYSSFTKLIPNATVEPYFFWRRQSAVKSELAVPGILNFGTFGARWVGKLPYSFDYGLEMARQDGSLGSESVGAWAGHWIVGYTVGKARFIPRIYSEFNFASGDSNPTDNHAGTFNQLYPTAHDKYGLTDLVGWQNIKHARTGADLKFTRKWSFTARESAYWLADSRDGLYSAAGALLARSLAGTAGTYVGQEVEVVTAFKFNSRAALSGGFGHLFPGTFLKHTTPGVSYNYPYLMMVYDF